MAALAASFMLLSYFPYLTYAVPAFSGLFIMITVIELGNKWALGSYFASLLPILLFAEIECKLLYVMFFGFYPVVKALCEKMRKPILEWIIKIAVFNAAVLVTYLFFAKLFGVTLDDFNEFGKYGAVLFLLAGNIVFVLYDIAVSRMAMFYFVVVKPKFKF